MQQTSFTVELFDYIEGLLQEAKNKAQAKADAAQSSKTKS